MPISWAFSCLAVVPSSWAGATATTRVSTRATRAGHRREGSQGRLEFNLGARDFILLVAHRWEIEDGKLDTACVKAFRVPAGTLVEVFNTTLHYTPCMVDDGGFQVMVALPAGTNGPRPEAAADMPAAGDSYCYWKADKWVLCHADSPKAAEGGYVGLIGKNLDIAVD